MGSVAPLREEVGVDMTTTTWTPTHDELQRVLNQLDDLNAQVVTFKVENLSEHEAAGWLRSEGRRLERLVRATGDEHG